MSTRDAKRWLFPRALLAFMALPGVVAFYLPWAMRPVGTPAPAGWLPFVAGIVVLLWCVKDFYVSGAGTLAPWSPPRHLVRTGLYRFSRNPMYVGVLAILLGWALLYETRTLWLYLVGVAALFQIRVVLFEEPWLARTHGEEWTQYRARVRRWL